MAVHGVPRATQDLDILVDPSPENAERVWGALTAFGAPLHALGASSSDLTTPDTVLQIGVPPRRIDVLTGITGVTFAAAWAGRIEQELAGMRLPVLGRDALVANKRATARRKDLSDLEALGELPPG